jgi:hypothetical protein
MLARAELLLLVAWCRARRMTCIPAGAGAGTAALLLQSVGRGADAMLLVVEPTERRLLHWAGQELATASDLPALLDAVDGGVADIPPSPAWLGTPGPVVRTWRSAA